MVDQLRDTLIYAVESSIYFLPKTALDEDRGLGVRFGFCIGRLCHAHASRQRMAARQATTHTCT